MTKMAAGIRPKLTDYWPWCDEAKLEELRKPANPCYECGTAIRRIILVPEFGDLCVYQCPGCGAYWAATAGSIFAKGFRIAPDAS